MNVELFILVIGGLGADQTAITGDQTSSIQQALANIGPEVKVWSPEGWNDFESNIISAVQLYPAYHFGLVGHSLGCDAEAHAASTLCKQGICPDRVDMIEPVWGKKLIPFGVREVGWYRRSQSIGFPRATVEALIPGKPVVLCEEIPDTDHNTICHTDVLISKLVARYRGLLKK